MTAALAYEPFELPTMEAQTAIDTFPANDKGVSNWLDGWKQAQREGWSVTVLLSPDSKTLIGLGARGGPTRTLGERW